jgi:hypothetical protein
VQAYLFQDLSPSFSRHIQVKHDQVRQRPPGLPFLPLAILQVFHQFDSITHELHFALKADVHQNIFYQQAVVRIVIRDKDDFLVFICTSHQTQPLLTRIITLSFEPQID